MLNKMKGSVSGGLHQNQRGKTHAQPPKKKAPRLGAIVWFQNKTSSRKHLNTLDANIDIIIVY